MADPILLPTVAALAGGSLLIRDYLKRRLSTPEDRFMSLFGTEQWEWSNMDMTIHCAPEDDAALKAAFCERLQARLDTEPAEMSLLREVALQTDKGLQFVESDVAVADVCRPRNGIWLDLDRVGSIRVVWSHVQTDGVGMWNLLRPLFDPNPPIVPYTEVPVPPPIVPEIAALPSVARRLTWRSSLRGQLADGASLSKGFAVWDARNVRAARELMGGAFNLVSSALVVAEVFRRHADRRNLNVGLTAYFPFLEGRNRYAVFLCRIKRGSVADILRQLHKQTRSQLVNWGTTSAQAWALGRVPDRVFAKAVSALRGKIDVLISSLPVGQDPIELAGIRCQISGHPWTLTLPYYFLIVGTRHELHVSYTSKFEQDETFLDLTGLGIAPPGED